MCTFHIETEDRDLERLRHEAERHMADRGHGEDKKETQTVTENMTTTPAPSGNKQSTQLQQPTVTETLSTASSFVPPKHPSRMALWSHSTVRKLGLGRLVACQREN